MKMGSLHGKPRATDFTVDVRTITRMIAIVHDRAMYKYEPYSWINTPNGSDASFKNCLDAITRHMTAYSMGYWMDEEGLPHTFHMAARASMMLNAYYQSDTNQPYPFVLPKEKVPSETPFTLDRVYQQVFPYIYGCFMKIFGNPEYAADTDENTFTEVCMYHGMLLEAYLKDDVDQYTIGDNDINTVGLPELLAYAIFSWVAIDWLDHKDVWMSFPGFKPEVAAIMETIDIITVDTTSDFVDREQTELTSFKDSRDEHGGALSIEEAIDLHVVRENGFNPKKHIGCPAGSDQVKNSETTKPKNEHDELIEIIEKVEKSMTEKPKDQLVTSSCKTIYTDDDDAYIAPAFYGSLG